MVDSPGQRGQQGKERTFILYDKKTGRIFHRHAIHTIDTEPDRPPGAPKPKEEPPARGLEARVLAEVIDDDALVHLTDRDRKNIGILEPEPGADVWRSLVDVTTGRLAKRPSLKLSADKTEIAGDGRDSAELTVEVADATGTTQTHFNGEVKVTTTRGKLSARRGVIKLKSGKGTLTITATNETIDRVVVTVEAVDRLATPASLTLSFV